MDAAVESLIEVGVAATTTLEVLRRAGVSRGALPHHFMTREDLRGCCDERRLWPMPVPYGYGALPWASVATSAHSSQVFSRSA